MLSDEGSQMDYVVKLKLTSHWEHVYWFIGWLAWGRFIAKQIGKSKKRKKTFLVDLALSDSAVFKIANITD